MIYKIKRWIEVKIRRPIRHRVQRAQRGWSDVDAWSLDYHMATILANGLKHMADNVHGCPPEFADKYGDVDAGCREWSRTLREMALGFEQYAGEDEKLETPEFKRSMELFAKWFPHLWD